MTRHAVLQETKKQKPELLPKIAAGVIEQALKPSHIPDSAPLVIMPTEFKHDTAVKKQQRPMSNDNIPIKKVFKPKVQEEIIFIQDKDIPVEATVQNIVKEAASFSELPILSAKDIVIIPVHNTESLIATQNSEKLIATKKDLVPRLLQATSEATMPILQSKTIVKDIALQATEAHTISKPDYTPEDIFKVNEAEFGEVVVAQELIDEINSVNAPAIIREFTEVADDEVPESIFDVLTDDDIENILNEVVVESTDDPNIEAGVAEESVSVQEQEIGTEPAVDELEQLPTPTVEFLDFVSLLDLPDFRTEENAESVEILKEMEISPLPPVCIEVVNAIHFLQETDPERAMAAIETLHKMSLAIDKIVALRLNGSELAPDAEEKLQDLCIQLFTQLGWALEPEKIMEFMQGMMQAKQIAQVISDRKAPITEQGTHEIKDEHDPIFGGLIQEIEDYLTRAIGTHAVRNYQFALA
ncbi:MAG: hypothetical protein JWO47_424 [Candidatus Saccharibacteria bacterium]|nr:hypothetical protein [Candidatus Saccharibacteria bacterium]